MQRDEIERAIRSAFQSQRYPGDDHLISIGTGWYAGIYDPESDLIRGLFVGKQWHEVTPQTFMDTPHAPAFFTPEAYAYYLPAFMLATLTFDERIGFFFDNLIDTLTGPRGSQWFLPECFRLLSDEQKRVIGQYLKFVTEEEYGDQPFGAAHIALERYWHQFL